MRSLGLLQTMNYLSHKQDWDYYYNMILFLAGCARFYFFFFFFFLEYTRPNLLHEKSQQKKSYKNGI